MKLKDKVALITGAGSGLGQGMALAFLREEARIAVNDLSDDKIEETLRQIAEIGGEGFGVKANVASSKEVKEMFSRILERFGTLDILVNNAAKLYCRRGNQP